MRISQPHSRSSTIPSILSPTYSNTSPIMVSILTTRGVSPHHTNLSTAQTFISHTRAFLPHKLSSYHTAPSPHGLPHYAIQPLSTAYSPSPLHARFLQHHTQSLTNLQQNFPRHASPFHKNLSPLQPNWLHRKITAPPSTKSST